jgi:hypothetical protein
MTPCKEVEGHFRKGRLARSEERRATVGGLGAWPKKPLDPVREAPRRLAPRSGRLGSRDAIRQ